ncbi:hypothetical protein COLO4_11201 [Corchorus olitorius]|uniref:Uncharacterized protein n=1 Tax=Corchorus olitorius TaxID=93759 RepID=A0A1R3K5F5_9ROSI|nr:hypothetical protein COLO4_11201 [Corchorus olitorius]
MEVTHLYKWRSLSKAFENLSSNLKKMPALAISTCDEKVLEEILITRRKDPDPSNPIHPLKKIKIWVTVTKRATFEMINELLQTNNINLENLSLSLGALDAQILSSLRFNALTILNLERTTRIALQTLLLGTPVLKFLTLKKCAFTDDTKTLLLNSQSLNTINLLRCDLTPFATILIQIANLHILTWDNIILNNDLKLVINAENIDTLVYKGILVETSFHVLTIGESFIVIQDLSPLSPTKFAHDLNKMMNGLRGSMIMKMDATTAQVYSL